jgi:hypothetical protein
MVGKSIQIGFRTVEMVEDFVSNNQSLGNFVIDFSTCKNIFHSYYDRGMSCCCFPSVDVIT